MGMFIPCQLQSHKYLIRVSIKASRPGAIDEFFASCLTACVLADSPASDVKGKATVAPSRGGLLFEKESSVTRRAYSFGLSTTNGCR